MVSNNIVEGKTLAWKDDAIVTLTGDVEHISIPDHIAPPGFQRDYFIREDNANVPSCLHLFNLDCHLGL